MTRENRAEKLPRPLSTGSREFTDFFRKITRCSCSKNRAGTPESTRSIRDDSAIDFLANGRNANSLLTANHGILQNDVARHFDLSGIKFIDDEDPSVDGTLTNLVFYFSTSSFSFPKLWFFID